MDTTTLLALALLGGVAGLDAVSCAQTMLARPIVAGPLAGLILGDPLQGMAVGAVLEVLTLHQLPVGASRTWDMGPAAVVAVGAMAHSPGSAAGLVVAVAWGAVIGWVGSWSVHALRHFNAGLVVVEGETVPPGRLAGGHLGAMAVDFVRAVVLTVAGVLLASGLARLELSGSRSIWAARALLAVCLSLAVGADIRAMVGGRRIWGTFAAATGLSAIVTLWLA